MLLSFLRSTKTPAFSLSGFKRKDSALRSDGTSGEFFFNKGFGLTMTLRARFCKQETTDTNHRALRVYVQETGDACHAFPCLIDYSGIGRAAALSLKRKD